MLTRRSRSNRPFTRVGAARGASHRILSVLSLGVPLAILAQALTSCGSDDPDQACTPNAQRACVVAGQTCDAIQTCSDDGSAYSECACPGGGSGGSAGAAGSGNLGGSSNGGAAGAGPGAGGPLFPPADRAIGAPCTTDAECPTGPNGETPLICITSSSTQFGGGPQGGYCSAPCADTDECQALDGLSGCGLYDDATQSGYCIALCVPGTSNVKCFADRAQACFAFPDDPDLGACFPVCQSDAACGPGLFCDLGRQDLGVCTAAAPVGGDIGAPCTPETEDTDCKSGLCVELANAAGEVSGRFCSANCTFGLIQGCGHDRMISEPRNALCGQAQLETGAAGDIGFCFELCDTAADCTQAGWECVVVLTAEGQAAVGRTGQCVPPSGAGADAGAP